MPYTSKVSSPGISIDTNNDGIIDGRVHQIKNAGNFNTFSITNGVLTVQGPTGGAAVGGSDTHVQFNDGGALAGESTLVYNKTSNTLTVANLTVSDTLTVTTTTTLNSNTVTIGDAKIVLNSDFSGPGPTESAGFEVERGDEDNVNFIWNETNDNFEFQVGSNAAAVGKVGSIFATQTASSPTALTYSFASDTNTGIQHTGADQLGLVVGNARVLMVNANGVHINPSGASGATNALDVVGDATITGDVDITGSLDVDNLNFNGNVISSTATNQHIQLIPNGVGDVYLQSDVVLGSGVSSATQIGATTRGGAVVGIDVTLYAGAAGAGADPNLAGGDLKFLGGQGKGTGVGGDILFRVAPPGSSGASYNSVATALTISGNDKSAVFEGAVTINGNLTVSGTTTTVSSTTVSHADPVLQLNQGETNDANAGVTGSVSGFQVDRGSNSGTDIAITRFVWDDSVDAFRCQIANNAPTNSTFVDTQLRVGTPSDTNDAATKGYVDAHTVDVVSNVATSTILGRVTGGSGDSEELSASQVRTLINVADGADVTNASSVNAAGAIMNSDVATKGQIIVGDGSGDPTILSVGTNGYVLTADSTEASGVKWAAAGGGGTVNVVSNVATSRILGRTSAGSGDSEELTAAQTRTLLDFSNQAVAAVQSASSIELAATATFTAKRSVVENILANGIPTSPTALDLMEDQRGKVLVTAVAAGLGINTIGLPDPGASQIGDTYVVLNTHSGAFTIDRAGGAHGTAQNLNGAASNASLPANEAVTLVYVDVNAWWGIGL